jgi:hypothetical protein
MEKAKGGGDRKSDHPYPRSRSDNDPKPLVELGISKDQSAPELQPSFAK